ncbi:hypothetical protein D1007_21966 [Hordeum vulgare]|nr:hypothetical protein D1007_21966 [Hordeum vulgare]
MPSPGSKRFPIPAESRLQRQTRAPLPLLYTDCDCSARVHQGHGSSEAGKLLISSCTAAKSMEAGNHASVRMAAVGSSYKEGEQLPKGWIDLSTSTGQEKTGSYDPLGTGAAFDKEAKLSAVFPMESADASIDPEATAEAASASDGNKAMFRVPAEHVKLILSLKRDDLPNIDYLDDLADLYTPQEMAERRRRHESDLELLKRIDDDFEVYQKQVRDSIQNHGYFEVDYDYLEERRKGYIEYVDSDYDDASDSEYDDDS